jgi:hypothetical protein
MTSAIAAGVGVGRRTVHSVLVTIDGRAAGWEDLELAISICREHHALLGVVIVRRHAPMLAAGAANYADVLAALDRCAEDNERRVKELVDDDVGLTIHNYLGSHRGARRSYGEGFDLTVGPKPRSRRWRLW